MLSGHYGGLLALPQPGNHRESRHGGKRENAERRTSQPDPALAKPVDDARDPPGWLPPAPPPLPPLIGVRGGAPPTATGGSFSSSASAASWNAGCENTNAGEFFGEYRLVVAAAAGILALAARARRSR